MQIQRPGKPKSAAQGLFPPCATLLLDWALNMLDGSCQDKMAQMDRNLLNLTQNNRQSPVNPAHRGAQVRPTPQTNSCPIPHHCLPRPPQPELCPDKHHSGLPSRATSILFLSHSTVEAASETLLLSFIYIQCSKSHLSRRDFLLTSAPRGISLSTSQCLSAQKATCHDSSRRLCSKIKWK